MTDASLYLVPIAQTGAQIDAIYGFLPELLEHRAEEKHNQYDEIEFATSSLLGSDNYDSVEKLYSALDQIESTTDISILEWAEFRAEQLGNERYWGIRQTVADRFSITEGDWLLFYTGDAEYSVAAQVARDVEPDLFYPKAILWPSESQSVVEGSSSKLNLFDESDEFGIVDLHEAFETTLQSESAKQEFQYPVAVPITQPRIVDIDAEVIRALDHRKRNFVQGFSKVDRETVEAISDEFTEIEAFLKVGDQERIQSLGQRFTPDDRRSFNYQYELNLDPGLDQELTGQESDYILSGDGDTRFPLPNHKELTTTLREDKNLLLIGPPLSGKQNFFEAIGTHWAQVNSEFIEQEYTRTATVDLTVQSVADQLELSEDGTQLKAPFARRCELASAELAQHRNRRDDVVPPQYLHTYTADSFESLPETLREQPGIVGPESRGHKNRTTVGTVPFWIPENMYLGMSLNSSRNSIPALPPEARRKLSIRKIEPRIRFATEVCNIAPEYDGSVAARLTEETNTGSTVQKLLALSLGAIYEFNTSSSDVCVGYHGLFSIEGTEVAPAIAPGDADISTILRRWRDVIIPEMVGQESDSPSDKKTSELFSYNPTTGMTLDDIDRYIRSAGHTGIERLHRS